MEEYLWIVKQKITLFSGPMYKKQITDKNFAS